MREGEKNMGCRGWRRGLLFLCSFISFSSGNVSEAPPVFSPAGPYIENIPEDAPVGFRVLRLVITDEIDHQNSSCFFTILGGNEDSRFTVDSASCLVILQRPLDREYTSIYTLTIQAEDSEGLASSTTLTINVIDVNDNSPNCSDVSTHINVEEGISTGDLYQPSCSDADAIASPTLFYSIESGAHRAIGIDSSTGRLYLRDEFDYETSSSHEVVIQVRDGDSVTAKTSQISVTINVVPVNEHDPVFTAKSFGPFVVSEDANRGSRIGQVSASDADRGLSHGTVRYNILCGESSGQFGIDPLTGELKLLKSLDREITSSYTLTIEASDNPEAEGIIRTALLSLTILVQDVNDLAPKFSLTEYSVTVYEDANYGPAASLMKFTISDDDSHSNGQFDISIVSGNVDNTFEISETSLTLIASLDSKSRGSYELVLEAADHGTPSLKSTATVFINVKSSLERTPLFNSPCSDVTILENTPVGSVLCKAETSDMMKSDSGFITFHIENGVPSGEFYINSTTGELVVSSLLDYDTLPNSYNITIGAINDQGLSTIDSLSIDLLDVNDNPPHFPSYITTFFVKENEKLNHVAGVLQAIDKDRSISTQMTYSMTGGNGMLLFDIDGYTGNITVASSIDYESSQVYWLYVTAADGGTPELTTSGIVKINILNTNDNDPVLTPVQYRTSIKEDAVVGQTVFTFTGTDVDTPIGSFIINGHDMYFKIDTATGTIKTRAALDRETNDKHIIKVTLTDKSTCVDARVRTSTATLIVDIEDVNDNSPISTGSYTPSVREDASVGDIVTRINATDRDTGLNAQLEYEVEDGDPQNKFQIDSFGNIKVNAALDRERNASYTLSVKVSDKGTPPRADKKSIRITITDVNDNSPVFTQNSFTMTVPENSDIGSVVGYVSAIDIDSEMNAALVYSFDLFIAGNSSHFAIDRDTGLITVASADIDREAQILYTIKVKVSDSGGPKMLSAITVVNINIQDVNDNAPIFNIATYHVSVDENVFHDSPILTVSAKDPDAGINGNFIYQLENATREGILANEYLKINATNGEITLQKNFDSESNNPFTFIVEAVDGGLESLKGSANVTITVHDHNDNRPIFQPAVYNKFVSFDGTCGLQITTLTATDSDKGVNGQFTYSVKMSDKSHLIQIDQFTGQVRLRNLIKENTQYTYEFIARDFGSPSLESLLPATLNMYSFVPEGHVVNMRLALTRADFEAQREEFLTSIQERLHLRWPDAVPFICYVNDYSGTAYPPGTLRSNDSVKIPQTELPVDVGIFAAVGNTDVNSNDGNNRHRRGIDFGAYGGGGGDAYGGGGGGDAYGGGGGGGDAYGGGGGGDAYGGGGGGGGGDAYGGGGGGGDAYDGGGGGDAYGGGGGDAYGGGGGGGDAYGGGGGGGGDAYGGGGGGGGDAYGGGGGGGGGDAYGGGGGGGGDAYGGGGGGDAYGGGGDPGGGDNGGLLGGGGVGGTLDEDDNDNANVVGIFAYKGPTNEWLDKGYGRLITGFVAAFVLIFSGLLAYGVIRAYYTMENPSNHARKARITRVTPNPRPRIVYIEDNAWRAPRGQRPPEYYDSFPPNYDDMPIAYSPTPSAGGMSVPSQKLPDLFKADDSIAIQRVFDGKAVDPETGRMYEYNTQTNERRWL